MAEPRQPDPDAAPLRGLLARLRAVPARSRFWGVIVPIHMAAFGVLYLGTLQLLERASTAARSTSRRSRVAAPRSSSCCR